MGMDEGAILRVSLACAVLGLIATGLMSFQVTGSTVSISGISPEDAGRVVKVCGNVTEKFTSRNGHVFFRLLDTGGIDVVVFNDTAHKALGLGNGDRVCITGEVGIYKGELEIILRDVHD
jgi:DNA/RNA endonuclease YhcR with UshA esterase domain